MPPRALDPLAEARLNEMLRVSEVQYETTTGGNAFVGSMNVLGGKLESLLKDKVSYKHGAATEMPRALACVNAAICRLDLMKLGVKKFDLSKYALSSHLRLDFAAVEALNIFPQSNELAAGCAGSIFSLLNSCKT